MYTAEGILEETRTVEAYLPLVKRIANQMMTRLPPSVDVGDLIQAGLIGLMDAIERYEQTQGTQFETYATQRVRGAMLDELRQSDWIPRGVRSAQRKLERAIAELQQKLGRTPVEAEIAGHLGLKLADYHELLGQARGSQIMLFEDFGGGDDEDGAASYLDKHCADEGADPFARLSDRRFRKALVDAIGKLPEREKMLMGMYYEQDLNFKEIAAVLGVTESRISQMHSQAVARLRATLKAW
jgi:RNA polymerase sigma factor for flagellar operon FliA